MTTITHLPSLYEVTRAMVKTYNMNGSFDFHKIETLKSGIRAMWIIFDREGTGQISREEFLKPGGLCEVIVANSPDSYNNQQGDSYSQNALSDEEVARRLSAGNEFTYIETKENSTPSWCFCI